MSISKSYIWLVILFIASMLPLSAVAHHVKGKINVKNLSGKSFDGQMVYLYANPEGGIYEEWAGTELIDSCLVQNQSFSFNVADCKHASMFKLAVKNEFLYYYMNSNTDMELSIKSANSVREFDVQTNKLESNAIYQRFVKEVNAKYFNPYKKREAINFLKEHLNNDAGIYLAALYSSNIPDRFQAHPFFTYPQIKEILKLIPETQQSNPLCKIIYENAAKIKRNYTQADGYRIKAYIDNVTSNYAILYLPKKGSDIYLTPVDTVEIVNGYFEFTGKLDHPQYGQIRISNASFAKEIYVENTDIEVNLLSSKTASRYINGRLVKKTWRINVGGYVNGSQSLKEYHQFKAISRQGNEAISEWIKNHPKSDATLLILATRLSKRMQRKVYVKWLKLFDKSMESRPAYTHALKQIEINKRTDDGSRAPLFELPDVDGNLVSLKDFRGKLVLLDFWASWCGPCKLEVPFLKEAHEKYKDLVVISLSSDKSRKAWLKAIERDKMTWLQLNRKGSRVSADYGVTTIPHIILIDRKGKIIANKIKGKTLIEKIEVALKK